MGSIPDRDKQRALVATTWWCFHRFQGVPIGEDRLVALGFHSVDGMRVQLSNWGLPGWLLEDEATGEGPKKQRRAKRAEGETEKLPLAKAAVPLFKEALDKLRSYVEFLERDHDSRSSSRHTTEYLQDGRFIQYTREVAHWAVPEAEESLGRTWITPAGQSPGNGVTELSAVYVLVGGDPEPLIQKLHPRPGDLDREPLRKHIEGHKTKRGHRPGLLSKAVHVARLIRGADLPPGPTTGEFGVDEQVIRLRILQMREAGHSDQDIRELLSQEGISIPQAEMGRLTRLNLPDPPS
jgi:hypothetical protein